MMLTGRSHFTFSTFSVYRVLIGAPKANFSSHSNYVDIIEPGVVWRCSLGRPSKDNNHCEIVVLDLLGMDRF